MYLVTVLQRSLALARNHFRLVRPIRRADRIDAITPMRLRAYAALSISASLTETERVREQLRTLARRSRLRHRGDYL